MEISGSRSGNVSASDLPSFELETYIQNYSGRNVVDRLMYIAEHCPGLAIPSLQLAIRQLKQTRDTAQYEDAVAKLNVLDPSSLEATVDKAWLDRTEGEVRTEGDKLELELKSYKNNLLKESIRMGNADLGDFYLETGDLANASKFYQRQQEYCTTHQHFQDMAVNLARVAVYRRNWSLVHNALNHIEKLPTTRTDIQPFLQAVRSISALANGNFSNAVDLFIGLSPDAINKPSKKVDKTGHVHPAITDFISVADVAVFIGLLSLATKSRIELQRLVDSNSNVKDYLEAESHIRKIIDSFLLFDYRTMFETLENYRTDYKLDYWLGPHADKLYMMIRENCYIQYVRGYKRGYLERLAARFGVERVAAEADLNLLISSGKVTDVKLDLQNDVFVEFIRDERTEVYDHVLKTAAAYERNAKLMLVNVGIQEGALEITPPLTNTRSSTLSKN
ncbi:26S proteasome subunit RPN7-domain-containing protein [Lipomyces oligophaga]|uniref:26S proteasome subunit RPN7-domain-containing protein n=1 Tax=Lipomyces oligophaga TaxID=45792 RepID=UPI0034CE54E9